MFGPVSNLLFNGNDYLTKIEFVKIWMHNKRALQYYCIHKVHFKGLKNICKQRVVWCVCSKLTREVQVILIKEAILITS